MKVLTNLRSRLSRLPQVLVFMNLPQDLDMLLPLAVQLQRCDLLRLRVAVTDKAWGQSPRMARLLTDAQLTPMLLSHKAVVAGLQPRLRGLTGGIRAVVTASESTANAHKGPHTLVKRANQRGIFTYTMQHGFDNVGLNYFDDEYPVGRIMFASQRLFTWGAVAQLPAETPAETRAKCVAVGCPKYVGAPRRVQSGRVQSGRVQSGLAQSGLAEIDGAAQMPQLPEILAKSREQPLVAVFENLHWSRYSDDYRQRFLRDLEQTALAYPQVRFLVKPHHSGLWLTKRYRGQLPVADNLIVADPKLPQWETFTAPALIERADLTITTPSTVAVDAARAGCPVAMVAYDMALPRYEPLLCLRSGEDWKAIAQTLVDAWGETPLDAVTPSAAPHRAELMAPTEAFLQTRLVPGDAAGRIVEHIVSDICR